MASLIKTYKGDLSTAIAGKIWEAIKGADEKKKLNETKASEEVKKEAVKVKKNDPDAVPVQNKGLAETLVKIFTPLDGKLIQLKNRVSNVSSKVNIVAGGVADTQKLLVSQNQLLEDKFDLILKNIGGISAIDKQREAEAAFDNLEAQLERGLDLSGTFAYEKTSAGSYGILGKVLSGILGNRFTARLIGQISRALIPKGIRSRARLLRKALLPTRRFAKRLTRPGNYIIRRIVQPFFLHTLKTVGRGAARKAFQYYLRRDVAGRALVRTLGGVPDRVILRELGKKTISKLSTDSPARKAGMRVIKKRYGGKVANTTADLIAQRIINFKSTQQTIKQSASAIARNKLPTPNKLVTALKEGIFARAMRNPKVQKALLQKLGPKGMKKLGIKAAAGGVKGGFPLFGTAYGAIEGIARLAMGDPKGMLLSFGSAIPAAGWGFAIIDILRDIDREAYDRHIEPNYLNLTDENFANFFQDALGLTPDQYERGNVDFKPPTGLGSSINAISDIVGVTQAFGNATGFGGEVSALIGSSGLSNIQGTTGYSFDVGKTNLSRKSRDKKNSGIDPRILEMYPELDPNKPGDYIKLKRKTLPLDTAMLDEEEEDNPTIMERFREVTGGEADDGVFSLPFGIEIPNIFNRGEGGNDVTSTSSVMGGDASTIEFYGQQGRDRSGEPGVDFSFKDYKNNYNLFPGYVLETGLLYGKGYGNVVVVRSTDPSNGKQFDSLYSHFPDGGIAVKAGQQVAAGDLLGSVGFVSVDTPGVPQLQPNNAGNMSGWHTSVDFFEPDSPTRYSNADALINLVTSSGGSTPHGLLQQLKPVTSTSGSNQSLLNNIEANNTIATTMTNMVESGSNDRLMTQRQIANRLPIVVLNNQIIKSSTTAINIGSNNVEDNFFEAFNLARHTV